jgi:vitamin K-dependent gamma-carboxylase
VRVEALVSLNGRPAELLVDPNVDLARVADGITKAPWIRSAPETPPAHLEAVAWHRP